MNMEGRAGSVDTHVTAIARDGYTIVADAIEPDFVDELLEASEAGEAGGSAGGDTKLIWDLV